MSAAEQARTSFGVKLASHYLTVDEILRLARRAEVLGYHSVWTTEGRMAPDSISVTAAIAVSTERVRLGISVVNPFSRLPGLIAISAASIDQLSHGRFTLGIGTGDPTSLERQHVPYHRPLARLRECVAVMRALWSGEVVRHDGETLRVSELRMDFRPHAERIPIYVAATGPRALRQANEIGDGILLNVCVGRPAVDGVLAMADRARGVRVIGNIVVGMHRDADTAVRGTKPHIVRYLTGFPAIVRASGVPDDVVREVAAAARHGMASACAALPDRYVTELAAVGTPADCREWISRYSAGLDEALLTPAFGDPDFILDELAGLAHGS